MSESSTQSKKLEWKWVGIVFSLLLLFYLLPILVTGKVFVRYPEYVVGAPYESPAVHGLQAFFLGIWFVVGVVIVTGFAAFYARKGILWESGISALLIAVVLFLLYFSHIMIREVRILEQSPHSRDLSPSTNATILTVVVFLLSLGGAWLGERLRKALKTTTPRLD